MKTKKYKFICASCGINAITDNENAQLLCQSCNTIMTIAPNSKADFEELLASAYDKIHNLNQQILSLQQDKLGLESLLNNSNGNKGNKGNKDKNVTEELPKF